MSDITMLVLACILCILAYIGYEWSYKHEEK